MHRYQIKKINQDILRTKRAIISLGCSFTYGSGAINEEIYKNYKWISTYETGTTPQWFLSYDDKKKLISEFPDIEIESDGRLNFVRHTINNSFVNVLTKKYYNGDYAAINLARPGGGNRSTIKDLYFYPDILWNEIKEIIVIFCPSGMERFDYIEDNFIKINDHQRWTTMSPSSNDQNAETPTLSQQYKDKMYSEKFEIVESLAAVQELLLWCAHKKAKLIITPAFSSKYTKSYFLEQLAKTIVRDANRSLIEILNESQITTDGKKLCDMWPWDKMFMPDGELTFADLCVKQEPQKEGEIPWIYSYLNTGSPNYWVTPCAHPGAKGHDLFAQHLYNHIEKNL